MAPSHIHIRSIFVKEKDDIISGLYLRLTDLVATNADEFVGLQHNTRRIILEKQRFCKNTQILMLPVIVSNIFSLGYDIISHKKEIYMTKYRNTSMHLVCKTIKMD